MVRTPLVRPEEYFRRWDGFSLSRAFGVVLALWLSVLVGSAALLVVLVTRLPDAPADAIGQAVWTAVVRSLPLLLTFALSWVLLAAVLHVAARLRGGNGAFGRTLAIAGWGLAPTVVVVLVVVVLGGIEVAMTTFPDDLEAAARLFGDVLERADRGLGVVLQLGAAIWQAYVFAGGLVVGHGLEERDAAVAGGVVAFLGFLVALA